MDTIRNYVAERMFTSSERFMNSRNEVILYQQGEALHVIVSTVDRMLSLLTYDPAAKKSLHETHTFAAKNGVDKMVYNIIIMTKPEELIVAAGDAIDIPHTVHAPVHTLDGVMRLNWTTLGRERLNVFTINRRSYRKPNKKKPLTLNLGVPDNIIDEADWYVTCYNVQKDNALVGAIVSLTSIVATAINVVYRRSRNQYFGNRGIVADRTEFKMIDEIIERYTNVSTTIDEDAARFVLSIIRNMTQP